MSVLISAFHNLYLRFDAVFVDADEKAIDSWEFEEVTEDCLPIGRTIKAAGELPPGSQAMRGEHIHRCEAAARLFPIRHYEAPVIGFLLVMPSPNWVQIKLSENGSELGLWLSRGEATALGTMMVEICKEAVKKFPGRPKEGPL